MTKFKDKEGAVAVLLSFNLSIGHTRRRTTTRSRSDVGVIHREFLYVG